MKKIQLKLTPAPWGNRNPPPKDKVSLSGDPEVEAALDEFARKQWERLNPEHPGDYEDDSLYDSFYDAFLSDCGDK